MSGIYVHIPFCKQACTYCDFHFSTRTERMNDLLRTILREIEDRAPELRGSIVDTIYFGGGTPSLVPVGEMQKLMRWIRANTAANEGAEVTLEANPDDISAENLIRWKEIGITRLSLGTQSFRDERLRFMGRAHNAEQALKSIELISKAGFTSWTIDLIYGLPGMTLDEWDEQLTIALDHGMPHLSAYCLTVEAKTALAHQVKKGIVHMPGDNDQSAQFDRLMERMENAGLDHYEISNFGRPGHYSRHNSAYWSGVPYLGIGPSAHSFDGRSRRWNIANNAAYMKAMDADQPYWQSEELTAAQRTNERLMTGLRTSTGVALDQLEHDIMVINSSALQRHVSNGHLLLLEGRLVLTKAGRHFADRIASDLFITGDDR